MREEELQDNQAADRRSATPARSRAFFWMWLVALIISLVTLSISVDQVTQDRPTLRAMAADESMSDAQARAVADNTVRVWSREKNAKHLLNVRAMSCPVAPPGVLANEIAALEGRGRTPFRPFIVAATSGFQRDGAWWKLNVFSEVGGVVFTMNILDGELRVCQIDSAPKL
ncbi:hypothetical protein [Mycolicibacterium fallax]|uniref:hypothetical protein n=1 Tax=Mycolicibacterium fallax TaxID=1793 RepID=UPI001056302F|nr:hypothetical protein [Mycolicibacterium fallax]BBY97546.1 hypothetical protein MFAL_10130 [Mycolicibacterium fallax]